MRKETLRRGTAAYNLAKAQGRLPSQIAAKKKAKFDESTAGKVLKGFGKMKATPKAKAAKKAAVKRTPSGRTAKAVKKSVTGRGKSERVISMKAVESKGGSRMGSSGTTKGSKTSPKATTRSNTRTGGRGKQSRDTKLFSGKFTSRGNRR
jgi:hypothetical protein